MQVTLSELRANTASIVDRVDKRSEPAVITRRGKAIAILMPRAQAVANSDELTAEEWKTVRQGIDESRAQIRAGLGIPLEQAKLILRAKWSKQNEKSKRR